MAAVLVTGVAGFIGSFIARRLLDDNVHVVGLDNLNPYYSVELKQGRLAPLKAYEQFHFLHQDLTDWPSLAQAFQAYAFDYVIHMGAQAGVRYSLTNPQSYIDSNVTGFLNILEACRHHPVKHLIYASSSSVYGANRLYPLTEDQTVDHPVSLYAASKKANELMAHSYAHLYAIPSTGVRFFTVYGPWGRPDMALFKFVKNALAGQPIELYNYGQMKRDFTYIDDVVAGVVKLLNVHPEPDENWDGKQPDPGISYTNYRVYNMGNSQPVELSQFVEAIEHELGFRIEKQYLPMQMGDVPMTYAGTQRLYDAVGYKPQTSVQYGVSQFIQWYRDYYQV